MSLFPRQKRCFTTITSQMNSQWTLAGQHVALRRMTHEDQDAFREWLQNPELRTLVDDKRVPGPDDQKKWFARSQEPDRDFFAVVTLPDGALIGNGGLVDIDPENNDAQLRITIGNPEAWGKGYGTEATALIIRYAFEHRKLSSLWLHVIKENTRAIRTYEKNGFKPSGECEYGHLLMRLDAPGMR